MEKESKSYKRSWWRKTREGEVKQTHCKQVTREVKQTHRKQVAREVKQTHSKQVAKEATETSAANSDDICTRMSPY